MLKAVDKAWAAGFFDGEGCIIIQRRKCQKVTHKIQHLLHIEVAQVDILPLKLLKKFFGGRLYYDNYSEINKWIITNRNAAKFLYLIKNHLTTKKKECTVALKFNDLIKPIGKTGRSYGLSKSQFLKRENLYNKLRQIRKVKYG